MLVSTVFSMDINLSGTGERYKPIQFITYHEDIILLPTQCHRNEYVVGDLKQKLMAPEALAYVVFLTV